MPIFHIVHIQLSFVQFSILCYSFCILSKTEWMSIRRDHESSGFRKLVVNKWICRKNCVYFLKHTEFSADKVWLLQAWFEYSLSAMIVCYWKSMYEEIKEVNTWDVTVWSPWWNVTVWNVSYKFVFFHRRRTMVTQDTDKD